ncbi:MAG TPA: rhodanese-like domain-containing protein [Bacteroidales bacterium]|nr:rhodanese-like domain-containing protein [Bacteroidales bacterium]
MIELTKTRRLTVATIIFVLIILVGLITFRRPDHKYTITSQEMLTIVNAPDNFIQLNDINNSALVLVDLRQAYDFNKGTIGDAINIPVSDILDKEVINMLIDWQKESKTVVIFSDNLQSATAPWMLWRQMGYDNIKLLSGGFCKYISSRSGIEGATGDNMTEKPALDYGEFIKNASGGQEVVTPNSTIQISPIKRTKKSAAAGGC